MCELHYCRFRRGQALDAPARGERDYQAEFHDAALRWADAEDEDADRLEKEMDKAADRFVDWKRRQLKKAKENNQRAS